MKRAELAKLFHREVERFYRRYPRVAPCSLTISTLRCSPGGRCTHRDLAWCYRWEGDSGRAHKIYLSQRALRLPRANVLGILRHELGHLADPTPRKPGGERRADRIAKKVTGVAIRYDKAAIQTVGRGTSRPSWLHQ